MTLGGSEGTVGVVRIFAGTIGLEFSVSVLSGLGGGIGGASVIDLTAVPGLRIAVGRSR